MLKPFIRFVAFFAKEIADMRRQPRLLLSLVLGPFLILLLFGVSFRGERPRLQTLLVIPPELQGDPRAQQFQEAVGLSGFEVAGVETDEQAAMNRLLNPAQNIDVVEIIPANLDNFLGRSEQTPIRIMYNEIDPLQEQWIEYLSYVQIKELNTALLLSAVSGATPQISSATSFVSDARRDIDQLQGAIRAAAATKHAKPSAGCGTTAACF
jgi:ABC-2 type transport system permease protein